jgi:hypothetical protein
MGVEFKIHNHNLKKPYALRLKPYALCLTPYALRLMPYALRFISA